MSLQEQNLQNEILHTLLIFPIGPKKLVHSNQVVKILQFISTLLDFASAAASFFHYLHDLKIKYVNS